MPWGGVAGSWVSLSILKAVKEMRKRAGSGSIIEAQRRNFYRQFEFQFFYYLATDYLSPNSKKI